MKKYSLYKSDYKSNKTFDIVEVIDIHNLKHYESDIMKLIDMFNSEYQWDGMFGIGDVYNKIKDNHTLFILFYGDISIGYVFFKPITQSTCFGYNLYVTKCINRPKDSAKWFYNEVSGKMLKTYDRIDVEIEDWNSVVFSIVESIGYKEKNNYETKIVGIWR
jgi:hypothetical protein